MGKPTCPKCKAIGGVIYPNDLGGWGCMKCGTQWGYPILKMNTGDEEMSKSGICRNCGQLGKIIGDELDSHCYWAVKGLEKGTPEYGAALAGERAKITERVKRNELKEECMEYTSPVKPPEKEDIEEQDETVDAILREPRTLGELTPRQILEKMREDFSRSSQEMVEEGKKLVEEGRKLILESEEFEGKAQKVKEAMVILEGVL